MKSFAYKISFFIVIISLSGACTSMSHRNSKLARESSKVYNYGYGEQASANNTSAMDQVTTKDENMTLDNYLRRLSGVEVHGSGANARITIRGINSFVASTEPLFVLNGMPLSGGYNAAFNAINPREIKNITVLKDAGSSSIYGSRGSNGVIVISLKKGDDI